MRIVCFIDTLNSGGAQRQIVNLCILMKKRGCDVTVVYYHHLNHFLPLLEKKYIPAVCIEWANKMDRIMKAWKTIRRLKPDVLLAFGDIPSLIAEVISLPKPKWGLVVSERLIHLNETYARKLMRALYCTVDYVTTNTFENKRIIQEKVPWAYGKVVTIYNSVDLERFSKRENHDFKKNELITVCSFREQKNPIGLLEAVHRVRHKHPNLPFHIRWFGHKDPSPGQKSSAAYERTILKIKQFCLEDVMSIHPPVVSIENEYAKSAALLLTSFTEGLPNVVCEAMACGLPVLMSDVGDAQQLVREGENGFLFRPTSSNEIAEKIALFLSLSTEQRRVMGKNSRSMAEKLFDPEKHGDAYEKVLRAAARKERTMLADWPTKRKN